MARSGIKVDDEIKSYVIKNLGKGKKLCVATLKLSDDNAAFKFDEELCLEWTKEKNQQPFRRLLEGLPNKEVRYSILDVNYTDRDIETDKRAIVMWIPADCPVKKRMPSSTSLDAVKKAFPDAPVHVEMVGVEKGVNELVNALLKAVKKDILKVEHCKVKLDVNEWKYDSGDEEK